MDIGRYLHWLYPVATKRLFGEWESWKRKHVMHGKEWSCGFGVLHKKKFLHIWDSLWFCCFAGWNFRFAQRDYIWWTVGGIGILAFGLVVGFIKELSWICKIPAIRNKATTACWLAGNEVMMRSVVDIFFDTYFFFEAANSLQTREAEAEEWSVWGCSVDRKILSCPPQESSWL